SRCAKELQNGRSSCWGLLTLPWPSSSGPEGRSASRVKSVGLDASAGGMPPHPRLHEPDRSGELLGNRLRLASGRAPPAVVVGSRRELLPHLRRDRLDDDVFKH